MGFLDILRGKRELKQPAADRLFAMSTAYVKLELELELKTTGQAAVVHAQRELGLSEVGAVRLLEVQGSPPEVQLVRLALPAGSCTVAVQRVTGAPAILTCRDGARKVPLSYRPLWLRTD